MPNNKGGKRYKRNKNVVQENKNIRYKDEDDYQEYAQITKALGNGRFEVFCFDGKKRLAIICGKMRKRVFVNQGNIVLVSLREWQDSKCDIIEKYNESDVMKLKYQKLIPDFIKLERKNNADEDEIMDDNLGFTFTTEMPVSDEDTDDKEDNISSEDSDTDDDIDIDDI